MSLVVILSLNPPAWSARKARTDNQIRALVREASFEIACNLGGLVVILSLNPPAWSALEACNCCKEVAGHFGVYPSVILGRI